MTAFVGRRPGPGPAADLGRHHHRVRRPARAAGDPAELILGSQATPDQLAELRARARSRRPAAGAVRPAPSGRRAARLRRLVAAGRGRARRLPGTARADAGPVRLGDGLHGGARLPVRHLRGPARQLSHRSPDLGDLAGRPGAAALLDRHHALADLRARTADPAEHGRRHDGQPAAARLHAGAAVRRLAGPAGAHRDPGGDEPGLRPHGSGQGAEPAGGLLRPCPAQHTGPGRDHARPADGLLHRQRRHRRGDLRLARHRDRCWWTPSLSATTPSSRPC